jgi:fimbrial isopeptide formation D2 family protein/LPXTG-motif cell wall-anchored protein
MKTTKMRKITSSILAAVVAATCLAIPASSINYSSASAEETTDAIAETESTTEETSATSTVAIVDDSSLPFYNNTRGKNIKIEDSTGREDRKYSLYQVFGGNYEDESLSGIIWGKSIVFSDQEDSKYDYSTEFVNKLKSDSAFIKDGTNVFSALTVNSRTEKYEAGKVADIVKTFGNDSDLIDAFARDVASVVTNKTNVLSRTIGFSGSRNEADATEYVFAKVEDGYYMASEVTTSSSSSIIYSKYMIQTGTASGGVTIEAKSSDEPTINKKIVTVEKSAEHDEELDDYDTVEMDNDVEFKLISKVPDMSGYNKYYFIMNDTMTAGLTLDKDNLKDNFKVYIGDEKLEYTDDINATGKNYTVEVTNNSDGTTSFKLVFKNFIQYHQNDEGKDISVYYTAKVNEKFVVGDTNENNNKVNLTYPNNPNYTYGGTPNGDPDQPNPGNPDNPNDPDNPKDPTTTTPDKTVYVYTASLSLTKIDGNNNRLSGATFKITPTDEITHTVLEVTPRYTAKCYYGQEKDNFSEGETVYYQMYGGEFTKSAPTMQGAADEYEMENVKYSEVDGSYVEDINGTYYQYTDTEDNNSIKYTPVENAPLDYNYTQNYVAYKLKNTTEHKTITTAGVEATVSAENAVVTFDGLGVGTYKIEEVAAPEGYTALAVPITVTISCTYPDDGDDNICTWTYSLSTEATNGVVTGRVEQANNNVYNINIKNYKTTHLLPTTGGIGTTIFYIVGSVIVIGAVVLLITKRRMRSEDE